MSTALKSEHELDFELADATLFAWLGPMFRLAFKHWPISLATGLAAVGLERLMEQLPWPYFGPWWVQVLRGYVDTVAYTMLVVVAYRFLVEKEGVGTVNEWGVALLRAVQIATIWVVGALVVIGGLALVAMAFGSGFRPTGVEGFLALGMLSLVIGVVFLLMMPIWFSLAVAGALSNVYAVRSDAGPFTAVGTALRLAFDQQWRVFWPSYVIAILVIVCYVGLILLGSFVQAVGAWFTLLLGLATPALGVAMTFVIERAYAPYLTTTNDGEAAVGPPPSRPAPGSVPPPRIRPPPTTVGPLPTAPREIADVLAADIQGNRLQRLVETVEHGLKADARFFLAHPDHTLAVAKRLSGVQRSDLSLRIVQPYLKEHRGHRQHLTVALFVANLLRDSKRLQDAAKFLAQVKALYPQEPMVDQLIKITDKAIAAAATAAPSPTA